MSTISFRFELKIKMLCNNTCESCVPKNLEMYIYKIDLVYMLKKGSV